MGAASSSGSAGAISGLITASATSWAEASRTVYSFPPTWTSKVSRAVSSTSITWALPPTSTV